MTYNNSVLVGNWSEERLQNEYEFKLFLRKRDRRELLLQRSRNLFSNLLKERPLAISGTFLLFGFNVQVVASDMPYSTKDENSRGQKMNYGDEFLLRAENYGDPEAAALYVRYTPEAVPGPADRMPIRLSATKDTNCRWTTMPLLPCDRLEGLGSPIKTGARLIIKNCVADKSLCVMNQSWMQTFFGPECGVTCRNYIDIHKRFTAENIFTLVSDVETKKMR
nr:cilia- and flagella-associated protein 161 isoform X3 [Maniola hyperantus]